MSRGPQANAGVRLSPGRLLRLLSLPCRLVRCLAGLLRSRMLGLCRLSPLLLLGLRLLPGATPRAAAPVTPHPRRRALLPVRLWTALLGTRLRSTLRPAALHHRIPAPVRYPDHAHDEENTADRQQDEQETGEAGTVTLVAHGVGGNVGRNRPNGRNRCTVDPGGCG